MRRLCLVVSKKKLQHKRLCAKFDFFLGLSREPLARAAYSQGCFVALEQAVVSLADNREAVIQWLPVQHWLRLTQLPTGPNRSETWDQMQHVHFSRIAHSDNSVNGKQVDGRNVAVKANQI